MLRLNAALPGLGSGLPAIAFRLLQLVVREVVVQRFCRRVGVDGPGHVVQIGRRIARQEPLDNPCA